MNAKPWLASLAELQQAAQKEEYIITAHDAAFPRGISHRHERQIMDG